MASSREGSHLSLALLTLPSPLSSQGIPIAPRAAPILPLLARSSWFLLLWSGAVLCDRVLRVEDALLPADPEDGMDGRSNLGSRWSGGTEFLR